MPSALVMPSLRSGITLGLGLGGGGGGGVLRFAVIRGRADFQDRLFDPKYFREGANLSLN